MPIAKRQASEREGGRTSAGRESAWRTETAAWGPRHPLAIDSLAGAVHHVEALRLEHRWADKGALGTLGRTRAAGALLVHNIEP